MWDSGPQAEAGYIGKRCLPDYEAQLERVRKDQHVTDNLLNALMNYATLNGSPGSRDDEGVLKLVGYLTFKRSSLQRTETNIIKEMEAAQK